MNIRTMKTADLTDADIDKLMLATSVNEIVANPKLEKLLSARLTSKIQFKGKQNLLRVLDHIQDLVLVEEDLGKIAQGTNILLKVANINTEESEGTKKQGFSININVPGRPTIGTTFDSALSAKRTDEVVIDV